MEINRVLGGRIKYYRERINMNQQELALKVGYKNKASIARIENGSVDLPASKVIDFANALGIEVPDLIKGLADEARFEFLTEEFVGDVLSPTKPQPDNYLKPIMGLLIKMNDEQLEKAYKLLTTVFGE